MAGRVTLVIELKRGHAGDDRVATRAAQVLSSYAGPAALMSFDPALIAPLARMAPRLTRGLVAQSLFARATEDDGGGRAIAYVRHALQARPQFIAYSVKDLPGALPLAARRLCGLPLLTWTVRSARDRARAARWADQMIFEGFQP